MKPPTRKQCDKELSERLTKSKRLAAQLAMMSAMLRIFELGNEMVKRGESDSIVQAIDGLLRAGSKFTHETEQIMDELLTQNRVLPRLDALETAQREARKRAAEVHRINQERDEKRATEI